MDQLALYARSAGKNTASFSLTKAAKEDSNVLKAAFLLTRLVM